MKIVICGGGTAGWLSALFLSKIHPNNEYVLIQSSEIGVIGTGEGSTGVLRDILRNKLWNFELNEEELEEVGKYISMYFGQVKKKAVRSVMVHEQKRLDGRKFDEIRPIWSEVDYLPMVHGSSIFTRGETQSLTTLTLGGKMDEQLIDGATFQGTEKFMLHYNFPPFSTGEARPIRIESNSSV